MLPLIELKGTPFEQGLRHGQKARARIQHNLSIYFERFQTEGQIPRAEVVRRAEAYWQAIQTQSPNYAHTLRGIAQGSGCDLIDLVALNVRYELLYHQFAAKALAHGCTSFAILPEHSAYGHLVMGENWDWIPQVQGLILHELEGDLETLCFTEAGIAGGKIGLNSYGLGLAINGLVSADDDWSRLGKPFHVRCYEILRARDLDHAVKIIMEGPRACSANFLIAQVDTGAVDVEAAPLAARALAPEGGLLTHTNHFLEAGALGIIEPITEKTPHSHHRLRRIRDLLCSKHPLSVNDLKRYLRDHDGYPYSVCRHIDECEPPGEHYQTVTSVIMDLHERALWISDGPPCESPYQEFRLQRA